MTIYAFPGVRFVPGIGNVTADEANAATEGPTQKVAALKAEIAAEETQLAEAETADTTTEQETH